MGQHKHNPNCQLAKEGKLPKKKKKRDKRAVEREIMAAVEAEFCRRTGIYTVCSKTFTNS